MLPKEPGNPDWGVQVTWHGHSCFTLRDSLGRTLVIDPFDETVGYGRLSLRADGLLITHNHFDHNYRPAVKPRGRQLDVMDSTGTFETAGVWTTGIDSDHDDEAGAINGPNRIFVFEFGGLRIAHFGDIGKTPLTAEQRRQLGAVDAMFLPVGGFVTIDANEAKRLVDSLAPAFVFPMHYGDVRFFKLDPVEAFTSLFDEEQKVVVDDSTLRLRRADRPARPMIYILRPTPKNF